YLFENSGLAGRLKRNKCAPFEGVKLLRCLGADRRRKGRKSATQKCPSLRPFCPVPRRGSAEWLEFLSRVLGFRGKARFVLVACCNCEGSATPNDSNPDRDLYAGFSGT